jgi:23S rRNA (uracil1939-C5)-methyltransferase
LNRLAIHGVSANGEGVGRLDDGRIVFVDGTLPGDVVDVVLTETRKKVQYGRATALQEPAAGRCASRCDVPRCGGCPWRMASVDMQAQLKRQTIVETLRRLGGLDVSAKLGSVQTFEDGWFGRHRVRLHAAYLDAVGDAAAGWRLGYLMRRSRQLVPLTTCPVVWPELERLALALAQGVALLPQAAGIEQIELAYSRRDLRGGVRVQANGPLRLFRESLAWLAGADVLGVEVIAGDGRLRHGNLELRYDHAMADQYDLKFEAGLFTQALPAGNDALVAAVLQHAQPNTAPRVLELHAGIGNFSVPLARAGAQVTAYEVNRRAAVMCERNARNAGTVVTVHPERDEAAMGRWQEFDVVLMDPPRTGARAVADAMAQGGPRRIIYVSCDAGTLARDAALLCGGNYNIAHIQAFDLFPQTPHVETLVVFDRRDAAPLAGGA